MRAILIGATGLVGGFLLEQLLQDAAFSKVKLISRRAINIRHTKLEEAIIDFNNDIAFKHAVMEADVLFCCTGTTQQKVKGDKVAYRKIDFDIPVKAAGYCADQQVAKFLLVSSVGANATSTNFYLRLKGETETAVLTKPVNTIYIMRPSMLLGNRKQSRWGETIAQPIMRALSGLFFGGLKKYKAIDAKTVASAMVAASKKTATGQFTWGYQQMVDAANA
ncbi:MAG: NAD(P)H-binding protein [Chitinophagaceae bacterium]